MKLIYSLWASVSFTVITPTAGAVDAVDLSGSSLDSVIVTATRAAPTSLPSQIPTTMESVTKEQVAQTANATDSEDAIKYLPSLLVRKRYIGDYNHAVLSSRASGTGNSARSAVYADGILLSNYLGNGASYAPRWMLVTPEEIERVDVMYGPFSAAYPGNSVGAVVDFVTRMPNKLDAHAGVTYSVQPFKLYNTDATYTAHQESASVGDKHGNFSWWLNLNHTHSHGQPLTFPTKTVSTGTVGSAGTPVTGAVLDKDRSNNPWYLIGTATEYTTLQDHGKLKVAYDFSESLRLSYVLGYWQNDSKNRPNSYLRDATGNTMYSGTVNINGRSFNLNPANASVPVAPTASLDFNLSNEELTHVMHGLSLKSHSEGTWDWEAAVSLYDYAKDELRAATLSLPASLSGGAGTLTDQSGTGWNNLAFKGIWRPQGINGAHIIDFGYQMDNYKLRILKSTLSDWLVGASTGVVTDVGGKTRQHSVYGQDTWSFTDKWRTVLGVRLEHWQAFDGFTQSGSTRLPYASRNDSYVSPKAAIAYQVSDDSVIKASLGRAVRMPTVSELYGATSGTLTQVNDPNLLPEKSWTGELTWEQNLGMAMLRATGFYEVVKNSLYSERIAVGNTIVSRVTNVGKIATPGVELSVLSKDLFISGLDISSSVTYADSRIKENSGYVTVSGDTIGKYQPRVPVWRATALINYRISDKLNAAYGARYSGRQYSTLDNSDPNGFAYQGASRYFTADVRVRYQFARQWAAALGIDNLNNYKYWNFHPYPQRSYSAELRWDL